MAALKPAIIKDTIELINHYKTNLAFRERFDAAIRRNINVTYKHRPLKLYFEVLASSSSKYKDEYQKISRLVKHDNEELIKNTFLAVTPNDLHNLHSDAEQAQKDINSTGYTPEEIEKINKAENEAESPEQKYKAHIKRLDETTYLAETKTPLVVEEAEEKKPEEIEELLIPGATPEYKKSYNSASQEEKARLMTALNQPRQEASPGELVGPGGEPIRNIPPKSKIITQSPEENIDSNPPSRPPSNPPPDDEVDLPHHTVSEKAQSTTTPTIHTPTHDPADNRRWSSRISNFFIRGKTTSKAVERVGVSTVTEGAVGTISTRIGERFVVGKAISAGTGRLIAKGVSSTVGSTLVRAGVGILAKLGFSVATGVATGGIGLVVGIAITIVTTFSKQIKQLGWLMVKVTIGIVAFMFFMFFSNWGVKMNSLLPPYDVAFAEPVPSITPSISITPTPTGIITPTPTIPLGGGNLASCTFYRGGDSTPGQMFNIPEWPALITDVATKAGVPPAVLAGILRVECGGCFSTINPTYITNDYDGHCSKDENGQIIACGVMQFTQGTFVGTFDNHPGNIQELHDKFGKDFISTEIRTQSNMEPPNILRRYSIRDSLIAAAYKVKNDAGTNPPYDKTTIDRIINSYYGCLQYDNPPKIDSCSNGAFNYGDDVWESYNRCRGAGN